MNNNIAIISSQIGIGEYQHSDSILSAICTSSIDAIPDFSFHKCKNLKFIDLAPSITSIGENAYSNTSLENIILPTHLIHINKYAFTRCAILSSITFNNKCEIIKQHAFEQCNSLQYINLSSTHITHIYDNAFKECNNLKYINLPNSIQYIGNNAFEYCLSLTSNININTSSDILIGEYAFSYCKISELNIICIENSNVTIKQNAFHRCYELKHINITANVITIDDFAFAHNIELETIHLKCNKLIIGNGVCVNCPCLRTINIPSYINNYDIKILLTES